jgi:hypothetical protein
MYRLEAARSFGIELGSSEPLLWTELAPVKPSGSSGKEVDFKLVWDRLIQ